MSCLQVKKLVTPAKTGGLRIRSKPSLQSEELGVIRSEQKIHCTDELTNDDGSWVKLKEESIVEFTGKSHEEAWCLSFHKALDRQLLVDVEVCSIHSFVRLTSSINDGVCVGTCDSNTANPCRNSWLLSPTCKKDEEKVDR